MGAILLQGSCREVRRSSVFMFHLPIAIVWPNRRLGAWSE